MCGFLFARFDNLDGILLVLFYTLGICDPTEFRCARGPCIDKSLQCDDHDQCGDESDECSWGFGLVAALLGATCLGSLLTILVFCCCCSKFRSRCSKSNSRGRIIPVFRVSVVVARSVKWLLFKSCMYECRAMLNNSITSRFRITYYIFYQMLKLFASWFCRNTGKSLRIFFFVDNFREVKQTEPQH